jgi:hypothetical protein
MDAWSIEDEFISQPVKELTKEEHTRLTCEMMLEYLQRSHLEVAVNYDNHIRVVVSQNTKWYQDFCSSYQNYSWVYRNGKRTKRQKRYRTIIKRCDTISTLKRMINGNFQGEYATRLMEFVEAFWEKYANGH